MYQVREEGGVARKRNASAIQSRRDWIRERIAEVGSVGVQEMSRIFGVSESTIRRDLELLQTGEGLVRFHGGMRRHENARESVFEEKNRLSADLKDAIADKAAALVKDGQTVFLNAGTTTLALFRKIRDRDVCIITNNVETLNETASMRAELFLVGGQYRAKSRSLSGGMALESLARAYADLCFLGTNGVSLERGLTTILHQESEVNRTMCDRARHVVCLADSSKVGVDAGFVSVPLARVATIFTDSGIDPAALEQLRRKGVEIVLTA